MIVNNKADRTLLHSSLDSLDKGIHFQQRDYLILFNRS